MGILVERERERESIYVEIIFKVIVSMSSLKNFYMYFFSSLFCTFLQTSELEFIKFFTFYIFIFKNRREDIYEN